MLNQTYLAVRLDSKPKLPVKVVDDISKLEDKENSRLLPVFLVILTDITQ